MFVVNSIEYVFESRASQRVRAILRDSHHPLHSDLSEIWSEILVGCLLQANQEK